MNPIFAAFLGGWEIILILAVVLVLFGAKKLPELAKGLGQGIKEFKKAANEATSEAMSAFNEPPPPTQPQHPLPESKAAAPIIDVPSTGVPEHPATPTEHTPPAHKLA